MVIATDLYSSLEGVREIEKMSKCKQIMLVTVWEQCSLSEPIETKYLKSWLLILLGSSGI